MPRGEREWPKKRITAEWKQLEGEGGGSRGWKAQGGTQSVGFALLCLAALVACLPGEEERERNRSIDASLPASKPGCWLLLAEVEKLLQAPFALHWSRLADQCCNIFYSYGGSYA